MFWTIIKPVYEEMLEKGAEDKKAKEYACYNSMEMRRNWSEEKIKKWNKESSFWDCSGDTTLQTDKQPVSFISEHDRTYKESYYYVRAHFRLPSGKKVTYKNEEDKHVTAQHILAGLILNKEKIKLNYRHIPFYLDEIELDLKKRTSEHFIEQSYIDEELGINRRADLLFELETPNLTFGKGFVFEIVNTESMDSIKKKARDWARVGYSLVVISIDNFDFKNFGLKKDNYLIMYQLFDDINVYLDLMKKIKENFKNFGLKKDNYLIMYQLFDDINVYLDLMKKIKENDPLIDSFNHNVREMEKKMFFWRSGRHEYEFKHGEKVNEILLYCIGKEVRNFKTKSKFILNCYDAGNRLIDIDIWENNPLYNEIAENDFSDELIKINSGMFKEFKGKISLVLNSFSKIKKINIKEGENAEED